MMRLAFLLPVLAAGCATMPAPEPERGPCTIDEAVKIRFAGVKFRERMRPEIEHMTHSAISRVIHPDDVTTQDFRVDRLNILLDDGGLVSGLKCG